MRTPAGWRGVVRTAALVAAIVAVSTAFYRIGDWYFAGWLVGLGSHGPPTGAAANFYGFVSVLGVAFAFAAAILIHDSASRFPFVGAEDAARLERVFVPMVALLAFAIPWNLRTIVLHGAPITDDESAYHLSARLVAEGRLLGESPPFRLFFDRAFLVNDGRYFTQYFLGWPLLLAPGAALGVPGLMNPLYSAATIWPLYQILTRVAPVRWAKFGLVLWLASPFLLLNAATLMAHTSCLMALVWGTYFTLRSLDDDAPKWVHAAVAASFCLAFWIRPLTAIGIGAVPVAFWAFRHWRGTGGRARALAFASFSVVAVAMAAAFLAVNQIQTGSPWRVAYMEMLPFSRANGFRLAQWAVDPDSSVTDIQLLPEHWETIGITMYRLAITGFGFPGAVLLALVGIGHRRARLFAGAALAFLATSAFVVSPGVDVTGPVHDTELMLPLSILVVLGLARIEGWELLRPPESPRLSWTLSAAIALILSSLALYTPVRFGTVAHMNEGIAGPTNLVERQPDERMLIFVPRPFVPPCASFPARHWVYWKPVTHPALDDRVVWVNHLSLDLDMRFQRLLFPEREAYVLAWMEQGCAPTLIPLYEENLVLGDSRIGGTNDVSDIAEEIARAEAAARARQ